MSTQDFKQWSQARLKRVVDQYIRTHPELSGLAVDKLVIAALEDKFPDIEPTEILAAVEMYREVERISRDLKAAVSRDDPTLTIPGMDAPALFERVDERGVAIPIRGREAYIEEIARLREKQALEDEVEARLSAKRAEAARRVADKLASYGLDTTATAYQDVPDEMVARLRKELR